MNSSRPMLVALSLVLSTAVGCGGSSNSAGSSTVKGTITVDGEALPEGSISFSSPSTGNAVMAPVKDGKFAVPSGMAPGQYKVVVAPPTPTPENPTPPASKIPEKYRIQETSDLTSTITNGANDVKFDLKS